LEYLVYVVDSVGVSSVGITNHTFAHGAEVTKDALMIDEKRVVRHLSDGMVQSFFNTVIGFEDALICWKFVWVSTKAEEVFNQLELGCKRSSTPCFKRERSYKLRTNVRMVLLKNLLCYCLVIRSQQLVDL
jgi:hypothetical protein